MAITDVGGSTAIMTDDNRSYLDWAPIIAGTVLATAISFVLLTFGSAIGLSLTSAYEGSGMSMAGFAIAAGLWLLWVQISSFFGGGYLAGRMRRRHGDASEHESDIRDGAHGLTVWAVGILLGALIAVSGVTSAVTTATTAATTVGGAAVAAAATQVDPTELLTDRLLRPAATPAEGAPAATAPATAAPAAGTGDTAETDVRSQLSRVLMSSLGESGLSDEDRAYVAQAIAAETGISPEEADQRITQFMEQANQMEAEARAAADRARRIAMLVAFMTAASLFISGAAAYYGATLGGNHRDKQTVLVGWNSYS